MEEDRREDGNKTITSIITYTIANIFSIIVSFISLPILTNIMSSADLGIATTFYTLKNIVSIICLLAISYSIDSIMVNTVKKEDENIQLSSLLIFSSIFAILVFIVYLVFRNWINNILGFNTPMMLLMFAMIIIINASTIYITYCNYKNKYKITFIYNILASPVAQIVSLLLVYLISSNKYIGRIIGVDIFNIIAGVIFAIVILYKGKFTVKKDYVSRAVAISIPLIPHLLSQILLANSDLIMIKNIIGESEAGIYSMAYTISNVLYTVLLQLFKPWSPWIYRRLKNNEIDTIKKNSSIMVTITAFLTIGLFTVAPDAIRIFLNKEYLPAMNIIAPICTGIFFQIMYIFFYDIEYYNKKTKYIATFSIIAAIINIVLNYIFINLFGYYAAAYTTLISYLILSILHYFGMKKSEKMEIYDIKQFAVQSIVILILSILSTKYISNYIIRYLLLIIYTIYIILKYKKDIKDIVIKTLENKGILKNE
ncbi:MAG: oligosaccharide flippase family protein [Clostridia bacterium]|nr:oligosaccharide flippase family protein [Clostridia bacterium]